MSKVTALKSKTQNGDFGRLRDLLVEPERNELDEIRYRLDDAETRAEEIARILPRVIEKQPENGEYAKSLGPPVQDSIREAIRRDPMPYADILYPAIGPAIGKAIKSAIASSQQQVTRALEHSMTPKGIRWRIEAKRTGVPFAEIVLLKTLRFRVEQVFWVHTDTGILLGHATTLDEEQTPPDLVSGMLTAISDFVEDSFRGGSSGVHRLEVADLKILIERSGSTYLAAGIRGTPPEAQGDTLHTALRSLETRFEDSFRDFDGDTSVFQAAQDELEDCLVSELVDEDLPTEGNARKLSRSKRGSIALAVALLAAISLGWGYKTWERAQRVSAVVQALKATPGIVVMNASHDGGHLTVQGFRDPLSRSPEAVLHEENWKSDDASMTFVPHQSLNPLIVGARVRAQLNAPESIRLQLSDGILTVSGEAPEEWRQRARWVAPLLAGVERVEWDVQSAELRRAEEISEDLAAISIPFAPESESARAEAIIRARALLLELERVASTAGRRFSVRVTGHADATGPASLQDPVSKSRALLVLDQLESGIGASFVLESAGMQQPASGLEPTDNAQRRVTLHVEII